MSQPWIPAGVRSGLQTHTAATENGEIAANGVGVIINSNGQLGTVLSSARNTAIGTDALASPTSGRYNTAMGEGALTNNTVNGNTAIGDEAMIRNTTGLRNLAVGQQALDFNTTGNDNTANGYQAFWMLMLTRTRLQGP